MRSVAYAALFERALALVGSVDALAAYLGVSRVRLKAWLGGHGTPSDQMFLKLVDLLSDAPAKPARSRSTDSGSSGLSG
jgi:predicted transcriptional regulator